MPLALLLPTLLARLLPTLLAGLLTNIGRNVASHVVCDTLTNVASSVDGEWAAMLRTVTLTSHRVIAVANQKGGVGKTTSTLNLAFEFHELGFPAVVVDLDPQGNATTGLGIDAATVDATAYEVLHPDYRDRVPIEAALVESPYGPWVLAGHRSLGVIEKFGNGAGGEMLLGKTLRELKPSIVLIDCPPNLGRLTIMALCAAGEFGDNGEVFTPVSPGVDELDGLAQLLDTLDQVKANGLAPQLSLRTVLLTHYDARTRLAKDTKNELRTQFSREYLGEISSTVRVGESKARQMPIRAFWPDCTAAVDYRDAAKRYVEREGLMAWAAALA